MRDVSINDDGNDADCLAQIIQDVSDRFEAEDRFEAVIQANPAPALIVRRADHRFVKVERGFRALSGYDRDAVIGHSLVDLHILGGAERWILTSRRLQAGEMIPQMEADLPSPNRGTRRVILTGQLIEVADQPCMLLTFADFEHRRRAEESLRVSKEHFEAVFRMAPIAMIMIENTPYRVVELSKAFSRLTGFALCSGMGQVLNDSPFWEELAERDRCAQEVLNRGGLRGRDVRLLDQDSLRIDCLLSAKWTSKRGVDRAVWLFQDITARRHTETELADAMEAVMKDASWFSRTVMDKVAELRDPRRSSDDQPRVEFSPREQEMLCCIGKGPDDHTSAERLGLSHNTVRNHVTRIYAKIGVKRRSAAVI